jgi:TetR/AcrR family transcriptional regulator, repressor for uid operon
MRTANPELHAERRAQILSAAERCFAEQGFHRATVAAIAEGAGVSMGLLYRYFDSKEQIVLACAERDSAPLLVALERAARAPSLKVALKGLLSAALLRELDADYARVSAEVYAEAGRHAELLERLREADAQWRWALWQALDALAKRGLSRKPTAPLVSAVIALIEGLQGRTLLEPALDRPALERTLLDLLVRWLTP